MREVMLIIHFIGLTMGVGTSFAFMFLGIAASKMDREEGIKFSINTFVVSRMGHIGLALLIISGGYLMTPYWGALGATPMLIAKLALVVLLVVLVSLASITSNKIKKGATGAEIKRIGTIGRLTMLTGLAIITMAVLVFR